MCRELGGSEGVGNSGESTRIIPDQPLVHRHPHTAWPSLNGDSREENSYEIESPSSTIIVAWGLNPETIETLEGHLRPVPD
ncbi:hypothetical protein Sjap_015292 [Stephania japonica]|uniref:Uncharacterized protein n=1 Tax=Stephania japonica TaxID=461633 RepID=A0AAP0IJA9_9MAGN